MPLRSFHSIPDEFPAAKVKAAAANLGLTINTGYGMPRSVNIISPDPAIRRIRH